MRRIVVLGLSLLVCACTAPRALAPVGGGQPTELRLKAGDEIEAEIVGLESLGHLPARIEMLGGTVKPMTGSIPLTASIANNDLKLRPGMQSRLILRRPTEAIVVPANAVFSNDGIDYVVKQESSETFRLVPVKTGRRIRNEVEILEGAEIDWMILIDGVFPIASQAFLEKE